jgi:hypothetical protein
MTRRSKPKRKPTNTGGKDALPRGGLKSKQTKVTSEEETKATGPQQTKLSFAPSQVTPKTLFAPPTPPTAKATVAVTPLATHPEHSQTAQTVTTQDYSNTTKITIDSTPTKEHCSTNESYKDKVITPTLERDVVDKTTTKQKSAPLFTNKGKYTAIRYRGIIDAPPSSQPFPDFITLLKKYVEIIQDTLGKGIYLAPWDQEQEATFPPLRLPSDVPDSRELLGIYLGTYVNPKADGSKIVMNL